jgi:hypothetical protein
MSGEHVDPILTSARIEVRRRMKHGSTIDDVDAEVIEPTGFTKDEKAALWLYAWSFVPGRSQRKSAELHLLMASSRT